MKSIILTITLITIAFSGIAQSSLSSGKPSNSFAPGGCYQDFMICIAPDYYPNRNFRGRNWMSTALTTANLTSIGVSSLMMINGNQSNLPYYIGIGTGLAQTGYGTLQLIRSNRYDCGFSYIQQPNRLAKVNIGIGAVTTLFNTFGLIRNIHRKRQNKIQLSLFSFQEENQGLSMGINLIKRF